MLAATRQISAANPSRLPLRGKSRRTAMKTSGKLVALASMACLVLTIGGTSYRSQVEGAGNRASGGNKEITPEAHKSIDKGVAWLLKAMRPNGGVGMDLGAPSDL